MREVEIKAYIKDSDILKKNLLLLGAKFIKKITQKDKIFIQKEKDFLNLVSGDKIFRIRNIEDKFEFNLKIPITNELDCIEHELKIDDAIEMENVLTAIGFVETVSVIKTREIYKFGELTFNIDDVEGLGLFVELEKIVNRDDPFDYQLELKQILSNFYSLPVEFCDFGYDTLLYRKKL